MKTVTALLVMSSFIGASAATAREAREALRNELTFCSQFVIQDPAPRVMLDYMRDCCAYSRNARDCRMYEWGPYEGGTTAR